jgi:hypothetical protein
MDNPARDVVQVLNTASVVEFASRYRIAPEIAQQIVARRPYDSEVDIIERAILPKRLCEQVITQIVTVLGSEAA